MTDKELVVKMLEFVRENQHPRCILPGNFQENLDKSISIAKYEYLTKKLVNQGILKLNDSYANQIGVNFQYEVELVLRDPSRIDEILNRGTNTPTNQSTMKDNKAFTDITKCEHCGNRAPMEIVAKYSTITDERDDGSATGWDEGDVYELIVCPSCSQILFRTTFWHSGYMDDENYSVLYPSKKELPRGLPDKVAEAFEQAEKVRGVDANAYGVLLGRVLELVCEDRDATGHFLGNKLQDLCDKGEIPTKLVRVAFALGSLRNVGAHPNLGKLTAEEIPILNDLTRAILEYVYTAPFLASLAESSIHKIGESSSE